MKKVRKFRKKPVEVEAVQFVIGSEVPATEFLGIGEEHKVNDSMVWENDNAIFEKTQQDVSSLKIKTLEGLMNVSNGDYIIKGVQGEFYPCKPDIFNETYEEIK